MSIYNCGKNSPPPDTVIRKLEHRVAVLERELAKFKEAFETWKTIPKERNEVTSGNHPR